MGSGFKLIGMIPIDGVSYMRPAFYKDGLYYRAYSSENYDEYHRFKKMSDDDFQKIVFLDDVEIHPDSVTKRYYNLRDVPVVGYYTDSLFIGTCSDLFNFTSNIEKEIVNKHITCPFNV